MTFPWLPDAALDPHPRLTWFTECCFDLAVLAFYRKEEILPPDYGLAPGTLIVSNHQRDADVPILTTTLCQRRGLPIRWPLPFYAMREDLLRPGFLAEHLAHWPRPLPALLRTISLAWFFRIVRGEPLRRLREFTLGETLSALLAAGFGDAQCEAVFNARGRREIEAAIGALPPTLRDLDLRHRGKLRRGLWGLRRLRLETFRGLKPLFRRDIAAQLARFSSLLDAGRVVYFAPEGTISADGRFGRVRDGAWRIVRLAAAPPPILPLALSYDPLGPGRLRVIVRVGAPMREYDTRERRNFEADLEKKIRALYPLNASHLLAWYLRRGADRFTTEQFALWFARARETLGSAGLALDPLLATRETQEFVGERLRWLGRKKLVVRDGNSWRKPPSADVSPGWRKPAAIIRYFDNALADHLAALAPGVERDIAP
ncbi:MAG TPA: 1-acyl-sn-glycerol-3-phosphate acyltransferase [Gammaproteobacteria bacterium]|nr:1-acyl-sn-glycerol-3-phosphate acyltransferase [Gammaproteobacteria bacterium]